MELGFLDLGIFNERQLDIYIYALICLSLFYLMIDDHLDDHMLIDTLDV